MSECYVRNAGGGGGGGAFTERGLRTSYMNEWFTRSRIVGGKVRETNTRTRTSSNDEREKNVMNRGMHERIPEKKLGTSKIDKAPEMGRTKRRFQDER